MVQVSDNYRRLGVTFEERAITRLFESQYQAQQQETWREVQREFGHAAGDALGRIAYGETPNRSPDHALLQLLLLEMDPHLERARRVAEDLLPYAILVLPQASVELAPELAEQLELALRDAKSSRRLSYETAQDLLAKAAPTLREAGERWPQEVRRSVAKDLLTAAGFLMRRARDDPPAPLLAAFDDLLGQLVDACKGDPERLVRQLHSVQDQMDLPDLLADPPGAEFGVRLEKVLRLRGR